MGVGVLFAVIGAYYYLRVVVFMYMREPSEDVPVMSMPASVGVSLAVSVIATIYLGVLPGRVEGGAPAAHCRRRDLLGRVGAGPPRSQHPRLGCGHGHPDPARVRRRCRRGWPDSWTAERPWSDPTVPSRRFARSKASSNLKPISLRCSPTRRRSLPPWTGDPCSTISSSNDNSLCFDRLGAPKIAGAKQAPNTALKHLGRCLRSLGPSMAHCRLFSR